MSCRCRPRAAEMGGDEDDDDFREFRKLEQQYAEATKEERDRLLPDFIRAIEKISPASIRDR